MRAGSRPSSPGASFSRLASCLLPFAFTKLAHGLPNPRRRTPPHTLPGRTRLKGDELGDQNDIAELTFTLMAMGGLLALAIAAVVIFFRVWRKENKGRGRNFFE